MSVAYMRDYQENNSMAQEHGGFAQAYRSLKKQPWYKNSSYTHLFVHLLLSATHKPRTVKFHGFSVNLMPGQLSTSLNQLSEETGVNESTIRRALKKFNSLGQISTVNVKAGKGNEISYSVITLSSWSKFNQNQQKSDTPTDTPTDTPIREFKTSKNVACRGVENLSDTPTDTPTDTQNNNDLTINKDIYVKNDKSLLVKEIVKTYNESFPELASVAKITTARKSKLIKIINDKFTVNDSPVKFKTVEDWQGLFDYMQNSDFLMGRAGNWQMTFDFMINSTNFVKIIEGNYDNK